MSGCYCLHVIVFFLLAKSTSDQEVLRETHASRVTSNQSTMRVYLESDQPTRPSSGCHSIVDVLENLLQDPLLLPLFRVRLKNALKKVKWCILFFSLMWLRRSGESCGQRTETNVKGTDGVGGGWLEVVLQFTVRSWWHKYPKHFQCYNLKLKGHLPLNATVIELNLLTLFIETEKNIKKYLLAPLVVDCFSFIKCDFCFREIWRK